MTRDNFLNFRSSSTRPPRQRFTAPAGISDALFMQVASLQPGAHTTRPSDAITLSSPHHSLHSSLPNHRRGKAFPMLVVRLSGFIPIAFELESMPRPSDSFRLRYRSDCTHATPVREMFFTLVGGHLPLSGCWRERRIRRGAGWSGVENTPPKLDAAKRIARAVSPTATARKLPVPPSSSIRYPLRRPALLPNAQLAVDSASLHVSGRRASTPGHAMARARAVWVSGDLLDEEEIESGRRTLLRPLLTPRSSRCGRRRRGRRLSSTFCIPSHLPPRRADSPASAWTIPSPADSYTSGSHHDVDSAAHSGLPCHPLPPQLDPAGRSPSSNSTALVTRTVPHRRASGLGAQARNQNVPCVGGAEVESRCRPVSPSQIQMNVHLQPLVLRTHCRLEDVRERASASSTSTSHPCIRMLHPIVDHLRVRQVEVGYTSLSVLPLCDGAMYTPALAFDVFRCPPILLCMSSPPRRASRALPQLPLDSRGGTEKGAG
ncbi:hypothetical protein MSAN_00131800 [Mycena sanguinolenta]|uniref:Uncharacterized protein n=1 Tax=Mycena sanguinolenta TaxID=230812 RepID=A0A8H7DLV7_9AGAR|nr:hypothetical protein MSAN_00131800 [Mycena sanguinolenta]